MKSNNLERGLLSVVQLIMVPEMTSVSRYLISLYSVKMSMFFYTQNFFHFVQFFMLQIKVSANFEHCLNYEHGARIEMDDRLDHVAVTCLFF